MSSIEARGIAKPLNTGAVHQILNQDVHPHTAAHGYPLSPDGMGRGVGVGEAVDSGSGILEHGGPEVGQWSVLFGANRC